MPVRFPNLGDPVTARILLNVFLASVSLSAVGVALTARDDAREAKEKLRLQTDEEDDLKLRRRFEYQHVLQRLDRLEQPRNAAESESCP